LSLIQNQDYTETVTNGVPTSRQQPAFNFSSAPSVTDTNVPSTSSAPPNVHSLVDCIFNNVSPSTVTAGRQLCHGPVIDLSGGIPLGSHVPQQIREQIWNNELIDLGSLLPSHELEDPWSIILAPSTITMKSKQNMSKSRTPLSFYGWNEAFRIYMAIHIEKYPNDAVHMLKYMSTIKDFYEINGAQAFRTYDQSFRVLRKTNRGAFY
jgi:hypothetical protein